MLEVYASDGTKIFDTNESNFALKQKTTVNAGSPIYTDVTTPNTGYPHVLTVTNCVAPFVCVRGDAGVNKTVALVSAVTSGTTTTFTFVSSTNTPLTCYVFDFTHVSVANPSAVSVGLQTFNSSGQLTLDLVQSRLLKVVSTLEVNPYTGVIPSPVSVPVGKVYAIGFIEPGAAVQQLSGEMFSLRFGSIGTNASNQIVASYTSTIVTEYVDETQTVSRSIVVDVTGL